MSWDTYALVALGGAAGSCLRFAVGRALNARGGSLLPWGTIAANVSGCFLVGLVVTAALSRPDADPRWRLLLAVGFCGGYTTLSTLAWETDELLLGRRFDLAALNAVGTLLAGLVAVRLGAALAARIW